MDTKLFENIYCPKHLSIGNANFGALVKTLNYRLINLFKGDGDVTTYKSCLADLENLVEKQLELINGGHTADQVDEPHIEKEVSTEQDHETTISSKSNIKYKASRKIEELFDEFNDATVLKKKKHKNRANRQHNGPTDITKEILGQMYEQKEDDEHSRVLRDLFFNNRERPIETFGGRTKLSDATIEMILWAQYQRLEITYERYRRGMYRKRSWSWFHNIVSMIKKTGEDTSKLAFKVSTVTGKLDEVNSIHTSQYKLREDYRETRFKLNRGILYDEEHEKFKKANDKMTQGMKKEISELNTCLKNKQITKDEFTEKTTNVEDEYKTFKLDWDERLKALSSKRLPDSMKGGHSGHNGTKSTFQKKFETSDGYKLGKKTDKDDTESKTSTSTNNRYRKYTSSTRTADVATDKDGKPLTGLAAWLVSGKDNKQEKRYIPDNKYVPKFSMKKDSKFHPESSKDKPEITLDSFPTLNGKEVIKQNAWNGKSFKELANDASTSKWTTNTSNKVITPKTVFEEIVAGKDIDDKYLTGFYRNEMRKMLKHNTSMTEKYFLRMINGDVPKPLLLEFFRPVFEEYLEIYAKEVAQEYSKKVDTEYQLPEEFSFLNSLDDTVVQIMKNEPTDEEIQEQTVAAPASA